MTLSHIYIYIYIGVGRLVTRPSTARSEVLGPLDTAHNIILYINIRLYHNNNNNDNTPSQPTKSFPIKSPCQTFRETPYKIQRT